MRYNNEIAGISVKIWAKSFRVGNVEWFKRVPVLTRVHDEMFNGLMEI